MLPAHNIQRPVEQPDYANDFGDFTSAGFPAAALNCRTSGCACFCASSANGGRISPALPTAVSHRSLSESCNRFGFPFSAMSFSRRSH
ncbi:hypothetical protein KCP70_13310 [Salmonella enterica subsp. enterica]|nr:hypothetical protein KCP70_13310 [Salmonella enterica subsp. enterica]